MKDWLKALNDYPSLSCGSCADLKEKEGARPICADGACPKAAPDGYAGLIAYFWSDLKATRGVIDASCVLDAYGLKPDRMMVSLVRYLEARAVEIFGKKLIKMEMV